MIASFALLQNFTWKVDHLTSTPSAGFTHLYWNRLIPQCLLLTELHFNTGNVCGTSLWLGTELERTSCLSVRTGSYRSKWIDWRLTWDGKEYTMPKLWGSAIDADTHCICRNVPNYNCRQSAEYLLEFLQTVHAQEIRWPAVISDSMML